MTEKNDSMITKSRASDRLEAWTGIIIAIIAAIMTVSELVNKNIEEEMMVAHNKHHMFYNWYQSKSVKQSLLESEMHILLALTSVLDTVTANAKIDQINADIERYKKEKKEILNGSSSLSKDQWVQDIDGKMGELVGVKEWEKLAAKLDHASFYLDIGQVLFQISIVLGAVCIIIHDNVKLQKIFVYGMIVLTCFGIGLSVLGYQMSL